MLVPCPSCGKRVSDRAPQCPFCKTRLEKSHLATASEAAPPIANLDSAIRDGGVPASLLSPPSKGPAAPAAASKPVGAPLPPTVAPADAPLALPAYQRGDFIGDSLQVIETLGEGGFGIVYLARSLASNEIVAVKALRVELLRDAKARAMFEKEARIWMDLGVHPNLVRARWITEIGGRLYIAMDYVRAGAGRPNSLEGHLAKGPIAPDKALQWAIEFCRGMEYAMSKGIRCHRDIKPANILIGSDEVLKISDFGIAGLALVPEAPASAGGAHASSDGDPSKTVVGTVFGTPTHMSPEQFVDAASCDERSDIYSFGVVLYQMASGGRLPFLPPKPPLEFAAQSGAYYWHAFRTLHTTGAQAPLTSPLAQIITRTLRKKREERYPDFAAMRADLEALYEKAKGEKAPVQAAAKETSDSWNDRGISLAALNRWDEALSCYDKALALESDSAALHNNRGNALRHLGRAEESAAAYDKAIALDPLYASAWENRALLYAGAQRNQDALACIERSLSLDPTAAAAFVIKGVMLGRLQRRDEELAAYDEALRIDPRNVPAWLNKANVLGGINRVLALECANQVLSCDPGNVSGWDLKGTLLAELGRPSEAIPCHLEAQRLAPRDGRVAYNLGNAWCALGQLEQGRAAYEESTRLAPDLPVTWYNLALSTFRLGQHAQSVPLFEHFLSLDPPTDGLRKTAERLTSEMKAGRIPVIGSVSIGSRITSAEQASIDAGALPELKEPPSPIAPPSPAPPASPTAASSPSAPAAISEEPLPPPRPSLDALLVDAATLFKAGRFDASLKVAELVLKLEPRMGNALNTRANNLFKLGRRDEACQAMLATLEAEPGDLRFWLNKVVIENGAGRPSDAFRSAIDLIEIAQVSGKKRPEVEEAGAAISDLQVRGTIPVPRGHLGWLGLGFESMVSGRQEKGLEFFDKAIAEAPRSVEALRWKGIALKEMKRADDALVLFDRALRLSPNDPDIHHDRGIVLSMLRDYKGALDAFDRALALDPDHVASLSDKGKYAGELGQHEVSLHALRRATALTPDHPAPWINKAM
ncbi:MAG: tetratricopeptide repeat protein, partial [Vicinamibacteria bacterium]